MFGSASELSAAVSEATGIAIEEPPAKRRAIIADKAVFKHIDDRAEEYVKRLAEFVAIPSVSAEPKRRPQVVEAVKWTQSWCDRLGAVTSLEDVGTQTLGDGTELGLPPVLLAAFGDPAAEPNKPTVVVYGHLDVQPAAKADGWNTEPFVLTEIDGKLFGRGSTDDKAPVSSWLWAIEAYRALRRPLPVHLRCVFEGMEESGSLGLPALVRRLAVPGGYLDPALISSCVVSDNYYVGRRPCITHGLRGNVYFHLSVACSTKDMHSGVIGGSVHEAMTDLIKLMGSLVDSSGEILVAGLGEQVAPLAAGEAEAYSALDFDLEAYKVEVGVAGVTDTLLHSTKEATLMHRWRYPTLSLHGIEGGFDGAGSKTVIPRQVTGKFSVSPAPRPPRSPTRQLPPAPPPPSQVRIVPNMTPDVVEARVREHIDKVWKTLGSPNQMSLRVDKASFPWFRNPETPEFAAASRATVRVHGVEPCLTREGGSIPIVGVFEEVSRCPLPWPATPHVTPRADARRSAMPRACCFRSEHPMTWRTLRMRRSTGATISMGSRCVGRALGRTPPWPDALTR